ncbi:MAG: hypothetical protein ACR2OZ_03470 [Verrucomicrobiales bacterium]
MAKDIQLGHLDIAACSALQSLDGIGPAARIQHIHLAGCPLINDLGPIAKVRDLRSVEISSLEGLHRIPSFAYPEMLSSLSIFFCKSLADLSGLKGLPSTTTVSVSHCPMVRWAGTKQL